MDNSNKGRIKLYCCGGAGINIGIQLAHYCNKNEPGFGVFDIAFIDTSKSNLAKTVNPDQCYLITSDVRDIDGGGKIRAENNEEIANSVRSILHAHKPGNINIVISSAGGGTGGIVGAYLVDELLNNDIPVIPVVIGSTDTTIEVVNTLKTLESYENIALSNKMPVNMYYEQNSSDNPENTVDKNIIAFVISMGVLASRENKGLDTRDLRNWLRHDTVTSFEPRLYAIQKVEGNALPSDLGDLISVASIVTENNDTLLTINDKQALFEYRCIGVVPNTIDKEIANRFPIHFVTCTGNIRAAHKELTNMNDQLEKLRAARKHSPTLSTTSGRSNKIIL